MQLELYQDLNVEVELLKCKIDDLGKEYSFWLRNCYSAGKKPVAPLDVCLRRMENITDQVREYEVLLQGKEQTLTKMENCLKETASLQGRVMYMRFVERKSLKQISNELGYSIDWIKRISSRARKQISA